MAITLRKPKISDAKEFYNVFNDPVVVNQLTGITLPLTRKEARQKMQEIINRNKKGDYYELAIIYNLKYIGSICLEKPSLDKTVFTLGYAIGRKFWNKGITTEAAMKIIDFGFNELKLKKIVADNDEDNPASARVLEKNGFKFVKKVRRRRGKTGKKINVLYWEKKNPR